MPPVRIVVNGQQAFGAAVFTALRERGEDVVAVYCAPDRPGAGADPLRLAAEGAGVPVRQPASFRDAAVADELRAFAPELMVMAFVTLFIPEDVLAIPTHGSIQYHPSVLPRHRGPSAINWAIIARERTTGVTIFWPDDGLDTGPVLLTREVVIEPDDTVGSLYFDKLFPLGVAAMLDAVDLVAAGRPPRMAQDESQATYESWCRKADVRIDWTGRSQDVYAVVRGGDPRPGAWTTLDGLVVECFEARVVDEGDAAPGEVVEISPDGMVVAARDGALRIRRVRVGGEKVLAADWARTVGLRPGARFDTAPPRGEPLGAASSGAGQPRPM
jgi:methionyl-tRNA formyltransferase